MGVEPTGDGIARHPPVVKLSRLAGVSAAGARGRNPERSRGNPKWRKRMGVEPIIAIAR